MNEMYKQDLELPSQFLDQSPSELLVHESQDPLSTRLVYFFFFFFFSTSSTGNLFSIKGGNSASCKDIRWQRAIARASNALSKYAFFFFMILYFPSRNSLSFTFSPRILWTCFSTSFLFARPFPVINFLIVWGAYSKTSTSKPELADASNITPWAWLTLITVFALLNMKTFSITKMSG